MLLGTLVICIEWITFVSTQLFGIKKELGHWKKKTNGEKLPWIIQKYFENGFKNVLGGSGILSLFLTPLYIYVQKTIGFKVLFQSTMFSFDDGIWYDYLGFYLFAFRVFSCCIELYFISEYFIYALEEEEVVQTKKEKKKI